ncbi:hypothetical protein BS17DRAFT_424511 [Gyrodon lividus]|nr:hypothetical protein BS17DRAFT_424511 [Gyrodon lividus]
MGLVDASSHLVLLALVLPSSLSLVLPHFPTPPSASPTSPPHTSLMSTSFLKRVADTDYGLRITHCTYVHGSPFSFPTARLISPLSPRRPSPVLIVFLSSVPLFGRLHTCFSYTMLHPYLIREMDFFFPFGFGAWNHGREVC